METQNNKETDRAAWITHARRLPAGVAELSTYHGSLPSWYRYNVGPQGAEISARRAFEMLVSAACYLSIHHESDTAHDRCACAVLKHCSRLLREEVEEMRAAPEEMEALIWQDKQIRWKRHRMMSPHARQPAQRTEAGAVKRWILRWKGDPKVAVL